MNRAFASILVCMFLLSLPGALFAEAGQRFDVEGYSLHINATRLSSQLIVTGSVKGGSDAKSLRISCTVMDEDGKTKKITAVLKDYRISDSFVVRKALSKSGGNRWEVTAVSIQR